MKPRIDILLNKKKAIYRSNVDLLIIFDGMDNLYPIEDWYAYKSREETFTWGHPRKTQLLLWLSCCLFYPLRGI